MAFFSTGAQLQAAINALPASKKGGFIAFDSFFYGQQYLSGGKYQGSLSPIEHFVQIGAAQGNKPSATFDPVFYASKYADLTNKGFDSADLLFHFLRFGLDEGRVPNATLAGFDGAAYLLAYPDVATFVNSNLADFGGSATNGALAHYVKFGQFDGHVIPSAVGAVSSALGLGIDDIVGTAGNDTFTAKIFNNSNSLQSGDVISGGAGNDRLNADVGNSQTFAITPETTGVETVSIRAQAIAGDTSNNNMNSQVQIDAQRMAGVTQWESSNSRADVVIEDVRIANSQVTKDITIAMVETDPGHVDFGVYFDQYSLRAQPIASASTVSFQLRDGLAPPATPLANLPVNGLSFQLTTPATGSTAASTKPVVLQSTLINDALTYVELVAAINAAIAAVPDAAGLVATRGPAFTTINNIPAVGDLVVITSTTGQTFTSPGFTYGPASIGAFTLLGNFDNVAPSSTADKVTVKVILDDVGRGSTGGDLVIGGLSTGASSTSRGVERFEIRVDDNSKLETINSTNNTLQEVVITQGLTTSSSFAYGVTVKDKGNLTVNGVSGLNGGNVTVPGLNTVVGGGGAVTANAPFPVTSGAGQSQGIDTQIGGVPSNIPLPGSAAQTARGYGFSDVRLLDGSAMTGQLSFSAEVTGASIAKYMNLRDTGALPAADNIEFVYSGGSNNDAMFMTLDQGVAGSRSTYVAGREDFRFTANGGVGNDTITLNVAPGQRGGAQAWYTNQKLNANIFVNGGDGNDTIRTPGAGDKIIDAGTGDDTVYTDNTGSLGSVANSTAQAGASALAYTNAAAAELAAAQASAVLSQTTGFSTGDGTNQVFTNPAAVVAGLAALDQVTPTNPPALPVIPLSGAGSINAATATAAGNGSITLAQKVALDAAYGVTTTSGVVTGAATLATASTIVGGVFPAGNVTAAGLSAGNALLATYVSAANAALATAVAADANLVANTALLDVTQVAVLNATTAINRVADPFLGAPAGSAVVVAGLATLQSALVITAVTPATTAAVVAALDAAVANGSISPANAAAVFTAAGSNAVDTAAELAAIVAILSPLQNAAAIANTINQAALTLALSNDQVAVNNAAGFAALDFPGATSILGADVFDTVVPNDSVGSNEAKDAFDLATDISARAAVDLTAAQAINTALNGLKVVVNIGTLDAGVTNALANAAAAINVAILNSATNGTGAVAVNPLTGAAQTALAGLAGVPTPPATGVVAAGELAFDTGALGVFNPNSVDSLVIANTINIDRLAIVSANKATITAATLTALTIATAATNSGANSLTISSPKAVFVFDTSNQTSTYNRLTQDDRNLADLKSSANDPNNFFNSTVKVTFKGLDASKILPGTGFKTSDLEINQMIKELINNPEGVLSKLLVATDGPANTLVVTSLIDGLQKTGDLGVTVTMPTSVTSSDLAGAISAYALAAGTTDAALLTFMGTSKVTFDTRGDYVTQFAESGQAGGNVVLTGANSFTSSDNKVTPGTGNDVIVLGTTVGTDALTSSNEIVIYAGIFGNDTIVNFKESGFGIDQLNFSALNGVAANFGSFSADKSIVVAPPTAVAATALTDLQIAAQFIDSATAINHVYVAVDSNNIGSIWQVTDAAGTGAGSVTAKLVGSIDLADTIWGNLTAANFV